jgi:hypothetical protein
MNAEQCMHSHARWYRKEGACAPWRLWKRPLDQHFHSDKRGHKIKYGKGSDAVASYGLHYL